jgi:hypothetical protein
MLRAWTVWPFLLFLAGGGLGCDDTNLTKGRARIEVEPVEVDFGALNRLEEGRRSLRVRNVGTASLSVQSLAIEGSGDFSLETWEGQPLAGLQWPQLLMHPGSPGASSATLELTFTPPENQAYQAELVITSDAANEPELRVPLLGKGSVPDIDAQPPLLAFGGVGLNSSSSLTLRLANLGEADLVIEANGFSLESGDPAAPFLPVGAAMRLAAGAGRDLEVIYAPRYARVDPVTGAVVPDQDALLIASNDPDENPLRVPLSGLVAGNLPPSVGIRIVSATKLDGTPLADECAPAPSDTIRFLATVSDPDGQVIQASNLFWSVEQKPVGSFREVVASPDAFRPTFKADLSGEYVVCLAATDPQGNRSAIDPAAACSCQEARDGGEYQCPCVTFSAYPREDIRIELVWDRSGPDFDLHLVAPGGQYCSPTRDCRFNPSDPQDPSWTRVACVDSGASRICRTPNCDPAAAGCLAGQECYDDGVGGPACTWRTCSGTDCYWNARNPDWGVPGDPGDDPLLAIDCTHGCRAENINLNNPVPGIYTIMVGYYPPDSYGPATATVRVFFKGDLAPSAEFSSRLTQACDRWNAALLEWRGYGQDPVHVVTSLGDSHSLSCCD